MKLMWMTCCLWIISGYYDYFHDGVDAMLWSIILDMVLSCGCHGAFGLLVAYVMIIFMLVSNIMLGTLLWILRCLWIISG